MVCIEYKGEVLVFSNTSLAINFLEREGFSHPQISNFRFISINSQGDLNIT